MREDEGALIQRADLNQRLTKALEIKGHKSPIRVLDPRVLPVVLVEDLTRQAEWVTPTERKLASQVTINAVVAQVPLLAIVNPAGSGVIGVVERVTGFTTNANSEGYFGLINPAAIPAAPANLFFRDRRNGTAGVGAAPTLRAFTGTDAINQVVNPYLVWKCSNSIATPWYETDGVVIAPGEAFGITLALVNCNALLSLWVQEIPV